MRSTCCLRSLSPRLVAVALALGAGMALAAPGRACDHDKSATASTASTAAATCPAKASCPHDAHMTGAHKPATVTRTASAAPKPALKPRPRSRPKPAAGATAVVATRGAAGLVVVIDPETGGVGQATKEQLAAFAATSKAAGGVSTAAIPAEPELVRSPDGMLMSRVPERYMMNAIAHRDASGKITFSCGNDAAAASPAPVAPPTWEVK